MGDLSKVLSGQSSEPEAVEPQQEATAEPLQDELQAEETGEQVTATPAAPPEEPADVRGLRAALVAERTKRQQLEAAMHQREPEQKPKANAEPDPQNYTDNAAYWRDVARWEAAQVFSAEQERQKQEAQRQQALSEMEAMQAAANAVVVRGQSKYQDFDAMVNSGLAPFLNPSLQQALVTADGGEDIAYHLARHPGEAQRISGMKPMQMAIELGRISARMQQPEAPQIPRTLTQSRSATGQFTPAWSGPTPLNDILQRKR